MKAESVKKERIPLMRIITIPAGINSKKFPADVQSFRRQSKEVCGTAPAPPVNTQLQKSVRTWK